MMKGSGLLSRILHKNKVRLLYTHIPRASPDKILGINEEFKQDIFPNKVNLTVGAYRDNEGKPHVLRSVRIAEKRIFDRKEDHEYAGISGIPEFVKQSLIFTYGEGSTALRNGYVSAVQTLSGTGACRLAAEFIKTYITKENLYLPDPTWPNHQNILKETGLKFDYYPYYSTQSKSFNFQEMKNFIIKCPRQSWFLLHACAHNPTGYDPTQAQWRELSDIIHERDHRVLFDNAYQGFASGDANEDAYAIRLFVEKGHQVIVAQSYAKNFGLYGDRIGTLSVVTASTDEAITVESQLKRLARAMYSNPPIHGARIVQEILSDKELKSLWTDDCRALAKRIKDMRILLTQNLKQVGSTRDWSHITNQIGMFSYLGLTENQVIQLRKDFHVYCTDDSRISIAGINTHNVEYVARAIHAVADSR